MRDPGSGNGVDWMVEHKRKSAGNEITAPRIEAYVTFGAGARSRSSPPRRRAPGCASGARGADGFKFFGYRPDILAAAIEEAKKLGLRTACHHAQLAVARVDVLDSARWGLTSMEHWYGLPEALFTDRTVQDYPLDYNYANEQDRFGQAGRLWRQAAAPGSERWNEVIDELVALDFTLARPSHIYEASRDLMRAPAPSGTTSTPCRRSGASTSRTATRTAPTGSPGRPTTRSPGATTTASGCGSSTTTRTAAAGSTIGTDSGYIYKLYGFAFVREIELLREAGFHPLEVIRAATLTGAEALGMRQGRESSPGSSPTWWSSARTRSPTSRCSTAPARWRSATRTQPVRVGGVELHDQGRHRLRRPEAPRRRAPIVPRPRRRKATRSGHSGAD